MRPRLHSDATANIPLKIYCVSGIETILCLHYYGVVFRSVLTTDHYVCHSECKSISFKIHYVLCLHFYGVVCRTE